MANHTPHASFGSSSVAGQLLDDAWALRARIQQAQQEAAKAEDWVARDAFDRAASSLRDTLETLMVEADRA